MSYTPHTWQAGETVTAEKLNVLEQGVADAGGGGTLLVTVTEQADTPSSGYTTVTMNKTWQELRDAIVSGVTPVFCAHYVDEYVEDWNLVVILDVFYVDGAYGTRAGDQDFATDSPNGYPSYVITPGPR